MPDSLYAFNAPGSYGMQLPPAYAGMASWAPPPAAPVTDVPYTGSGVVPRGVELYQSQFPGMGAYGITVNNNPMSAVEPNAWMPDWLKGAIGTKEAPGWGGLAVGAGSALMNGWLGMKQYGLAKDALAENKRQFELNYNAQKSTTNTALEDRQRARVASNPGAYQSVGEYMNQNGIK